MILLIGKNNCNACTMVKNVLTNKGVEFEYKLLEELSEEDRNNYIQMAQDTGMLSLPLIIKNNTLKTLQEVM